MLPRHETRQRCTRESHRLFGPCPRCFSWLFMRSALIHCLSSGHEPPAARSESRLKSEKEPHRHSVESIRDAVEFKVLDLARRGIRSLAVARSTNQSRGSGSFWTSSCGSTHNVMTQRARACVGRGLATKQPSQLRRGRNKPNDERRDAIKWNVAVGHGERGQGHVGRRGWITRHDQRHGHAPSVGRP
jgi:hypothetical protein